MFHRGFFSAAARVAWWWSDKWNEKCKMQLFFLSRCDNENYWWSSNSFGNNSYVSVLIMICNRGTYEVRRYRRRVSFFLRLKCVLNFHIFFNFSSLCKKKFKYVLLYFLELKMSDSIKIRRPWWYFGNRWFGFTLFSFSLSAFLLLYMYPYIFFIFETTLFRILRL